MVLAYLGLGSNLGNRLTFLREARRALSGHPDIDLERSSGVYEAAAQGGPADSPAYLNAVLAIRTRLSPQQLLSFCQSVEKDHGRVRTVRWGPRTLDIDLLLYDQQVLAGESLQIPHPRLLERPFVLIPLAEIAPHAVHPQRGFTIAAFADRFQHSSAVHLWRSDW